MTYVIDVLMCCALRILLQFIRSNQVTPICILIISSHLFLISFYNELTRAINIRSGGKVSWIFNPHIYGQCVFVLDYLTWDKLTVFFFFLMFINYFNCVCLLVFVYTCCLLVIYSILALNFTFLLWALEIQQMF